MLSALAALLGFRRIRQRRAPAGAPPRHGLTARAASVMTGAGSPGHPAASATGIGAVDAVACGFDCPGDLALDVSDTGFEVATIGIEMIGNVLGTIAEYL